MKKQILLLTLSLQCLNLNLFAQTNTFPTSGSAGIGTTTPTASSILEMKSTTQGMLVPRMSISQRNAIASPVTGLLIYQTDKTPGFYYFTGATWAAIGANVSLSNLTTTSINQSLLPASDNKYSLGSTTKRWLNLYTAKDAIINGVTFGSGAGLYLSAIYNTAAGAGALGLNTLGSYNTALGYYSLGSNTTGSTNSATGYYAMYLNTTGGQNTANGQKALYNNIDGSGNTAVGQEALYSNTSGGYNTALGLYALTQNKGNYNTANGYASLYSNTTGELNTASGVNALYYNSIGYENTAAGYNALFSNTVGYYNTANGANALYTNLAGTNNTATGYNSLYANTGSGNTANGSYTLYNNSTGSSNTASGYNSLYYNTIGYSNTATGENALYSNVSGNENTATGLSSLRNNITGNNNTAMGNGALVTNNAGSGNTAIGNESLFFNSTGNRNTAIGNRSLFSNTSGLNNTALGCFTDMAGTINNATALGYFAIANASNQVRIGNSSVTSIGGFANWTNVSDGRVKKNIKENVPGLSFINKLMPVTYNLDLDAADKIIQRPEIKNSEGKTLQPTGEELKARNDKERILYTGFVAQDVEKAAKSVGYDFSGVDAAKNDKDLYGLRYAEFVVPLVKAVQELDASQQSAISIQQSEIDALKNENELLKNRLDKLETLFNQQSAASNQPSAISNQQNISLIPLSVGGGASLEQNIPNPFSGTTTINCFIPANNGNAYINFYAQSGALLKSIKVTGEGKNTITLNANELASGTYKYALVVDGKVVDSKQMVLKK